MFIAMMRVNYNRLTGLLLVLRLLEDETQCSGNEIQSIAAVDWKSEVKQKV